MTYLSLLASADADPPRSEARAAIVTIVIGADYERAWERVCCASWQKYARRIGVDIIVLKARIDAADTERSPAWQKLLILDLPWAKRYERIIWLDSDIIISDQAPNILDYAGPPEKVSLCVEGERMSPVEAQVYLERELNLTFSPASYPRAWPLVQRERYIREGVPPHDIMFNTGVMVLSPAHHNGVLLSAYPCRQVSTLYEQPFLSHLLLENDLAHVISPRFNWGLIESFCLLLKNALQDEQDENFVVRVLDIFIGEELRNAYFLHFYATMKLLLHLANKPVFDKKAEAA